MKNIRFFLFLIFVCSVPSIALSQQWHTVGHAFASDVSSMAVFGGKLYVAEENIYGGPSCSVYQFDGSSWSKAGTNGFSGSTYVGYGPHVYALHVWNNLLFAAGNFSEVEGQSSICLASWNGSSWAGITGFGVGDILSLGSDPSGNGPLYVGGLFTSPGTYIAAYANSYYSLGTALQNPVHAVAYYNNILYANNAKRVSGVWTGLGSTGPPWTVYSYEIINNDLYAGGDFSELFKYDGTTWTTIGGTNTFEMPFNSNVRIEAVVEYHGEIYAAGNFQMASGNPANFIARWDGTSWQSLGSGTNYHVTCMAVFQDELYVGGRFSMAGGLSVGYIAKWNSCTANISASTPTSVCSGSTVTLNANTTGTSYQWKKNSSILSSANTSTYLATSSGSYSCVITNSCGTVESNAIDVIVDSIPVAIISSNNTIICPNSSQLLSANSGSGLSYQWSQNNSPIFGATNQTYSANIPGNYTCSVTNSCGTGISASLPLSAGVLPVATISPTDTAYFCSGNTITMNVNTVPGYFYQWYRGNAYISQANLSYYTTSFSGTYWCKVSNTCGTDSSDLLVLSMSTSPSVQITAVPSDTICPGGFVTLISSSTGTGITYQWEYNSSAISGADSSHYMASSSGIYTCLVTTNCGTTSSNAINLTVGNVPSTASFISGPIQVCPGSSYIFSVAPVSSAQSYNWTTPSGMVISSGGANSIGVTVGSTFTGGAIAVSASNNCGTGGTTSKLIANNMNCQITYPANSSSLRLGNDYDPTIIIYPNPSMSEFKISIPNPLDRNIDIIICDLSGRVLNKFLIIENNNEISFAKELKGGIYFAKVFVEGKLIKVFKLEKFN